VRCRQQTWFLTEVNLKPPVLKYRQVLELQRLASYLKLGMTLRYGPVINCHVTSSTHNFCSAQVKLKSMERKYKHQANYAVQLKVRKNYFANLFTRGGFTRNYARSVRL